jgi:PII-like signaling protein
MTLNKENRVTYQTMCSLRIYLRRGDMAEATSLWKRLFRKPLASHLVHAALKAGITHASLSFGNMGFAKGAKMIATDMTELPVDALPVCVELVGPRPLLDQFVRDHEKPLRDATLVMLEGVHIRPMVEEEPSGHSGVEYVRAGVSPGSEPAAQGEVHAVLGSTPPPPMES